jgi:hypothetical protein
MHLTDTCAVARNLSTFAQAAATSSIQATRVVMGGDALPAIAFVHYGTPSELRFVRPGVRK